MRTHFLVLSALCLRISSAALTAEADEVLSLRWIGSTTNLTLAPGESHTFTISISNHLGRAIDLANVALDAHLLPRAGNSPTLRLAPEFLGAIGSQPRIPAGGYEGPAFSVQLPPSPALVDSLRCEFGLSHGTNRPVRILAPPVTINPPALALRPDSDGSLVATWTNPGFRLVQGDQWVGGRFRRVTNVPSIRGDHVTVRLAPTNAQRSFRLEGP